ncbi:hypothetical protein NXC12_PD00135 (plasmid) [Rhizobium etli]|uniref:Uncharacterized protein n=1 Tax=Rhizobium etli TaxID=29449 RepID=A0AAN1EMQ8_RHIET|nr:hypothetical protein [Rhizobium etli]ARQ13240.1 hypothetical protein NXC12_PD00135 [Rhizobium etli]
MELRSPLRQRQASVEVRKRPELYSRFEFSSLADRHGVDRLVSFNFDSGVLDQFSELAHDLSGHCFLIDLSMLRISSFTV